MSITYLIGNYLRVIPTFKNPVTISLVVPKNLVVYPSTIKIYPSFIDVNISGTKVVTLDVRVSQRTGYSPFTTFIYPRITVNDPDFLSQHTLNSITTFYDYSRDPSNNTTTIINSNANWESIAIPYTYSGYKGKTFDIRLAIVFTKYDNNLYAPDPSLKHNMIICGFNEKQILPEECMNDFVTSLY